MQTAMTWMVNHLAHVQANEVLPKGRKAVDLHAAKGKDHKSPGVVNWPGAYGNTSSGWVTPSRIGS